MSDSEPSGPSSTPAVVDVTALEDLAYYLGILDDEAQAQETSNSLRAEKEDQLAHAENTAAIRLGALEKRRLALAVEESEVREQLGNARELIVGARERQKELEHRDRETEAESLRIASMLNSRRGSYVFRLIQTKLQEKQAAKQQLVSSMVEMEADLLQHDRELQELAVKRRSLNEEEYNRRVFNFDRKRQRSQEKLNGLQNLLENLRRVGVTRTTAGFLVWSGYLTFPAFGWMAGEVLASHAETRGGILRELVQLLAAAAVNLENTIGTFWAVATLALAPLLPLFAIGLVFWLVDFFLSTFDQRWRSRARGKTRGRREESPIYSLNWYSSSITRSDYTKYIAKIPLAFAVLMFPSVLSALLLLGEGAGFDADRMTLANPWESVFFTILGVVLAVGVAGMSLLYVLKVIEPRLAGRPRAGGNWFTGNLEVVVIVALAVLFALSIDIGEMSRSGQGDGWLERSLIGMLLMLVLGGIVVAYGLLFRGLYMDERALRREVALYEAEVERYSALPAVPLSDAEQDDYRAKLERVDVEIDRAWREVEDWLHPWQKAFTLRPLQGKGARANELDLVDSLLEPDLTRELDEVLGRLRLIKTEEAGVAAEISSLSATIEGLKIRMADLLGNIVNIDETEFTLRKILQDDKVRLRRFYLEASARVEVAFRLGRKLSQSLNSEPVEVAA